jgi:hypothetical protein
MYSKQGIFGWITDNMLLATTILDLIMLLTPSFITVSCLSINNRELVWITHFYRQKPNLLSKIKVNQTFFVRESMHE